jgi:hypothetical protein
MHQPRLGGAVGDVASTVGAQSGRGYSSPRRIVHQLINEDRRTALHPSRRAASVIGEPVGRLSVSSADIVIVD